MGGEDQESEVLRLLLGGEAQWWSPGTGTRAQKTDLEHLTLLPPIPYERALPHPLYMVCGWISGYSAY